MAIPVINIGSKLDGKGFKQAETALGKLSGSAKKLAGSFGLAFGTAAVVAFGKKSIKAFADSESEATRLRIAVSNLGLAFAAPEIDRYIDKIELATGVNRDQLQPAFLTLLQTTGSLTKSQELLNLSLDVSAATGADASSVAEKLSQAYLGNTKGLKTLNLGLTTAELNSANFETIQERITKLFAGQGQAAADSYTGQINKLAIASEQASEIIGGGLIDSLLILSGNTDVNALADDMLTAAYNTAEFTRSVTELAKAINAPVKGLAEIVARFVKATDPFVDLIIEGDPSGFLTKKPPLASSAPSTGFNGKTFYADAEKNAKALAKAEAEAKKRAAELLKIKNKQLESERKSLAAKKLAAAIDKANLLLNKGEEIFDLEKIQIGAALTNQADQLGKITNQSQMLAIANDVARLNVKKSMLELEDAIASKDEAAIIAATAKLNADLKILGALNGQNLKLTDIKSILDSLKPKDLINITNLNEALAKIQEMLRLLALANTAATAKVPTSASLGSGIPVGDYIEPISKEVASKGSIGAILEYAEAATARANAFAELQEAQNIADELALNEYIKKLGMASSATTIDSTSSVPIATAAAIQSGNRYAAQAAAQYAITINAGYGTDPEALARTFEDILNQSGYRGTSTNRGSGVYTE
jgi:rubrerythrin